MRARAARPPRTLPRLELLEGRAVPAVVTVTTTADDLTPNDGSVSLREAITAMNAGNDLGDPDITAQNPGTFGTADTIAFNIPGAGVRTIAVSSQLPPVNAPVFINGYSQPGASVNTLAAGDNAVLLVEISGANVSGGGANGLEIAGSGTTVRGLVINGFKRDQNSAGGNAIFLPNLGTDTGTVIAGNFLGTDPAGGSAVPNDGFGVRAGATARNTVIGGLDPEDRNIISGNRAGGVAVDGDSSAVEGNYIGTNAAGTAAVGGSLTGVIVSAGNVTVGGPDPRAANVISGNTDRGVFLTTTTGTGNLVQGNFIGTDAAGTAALPNGTGITVNGVGGTAVTGNVISGNTGDGVQLFNGATGTVIQNNRIGTDAAGTHPLGNGLNGVEFAFFPGNADPSGNTVGGTGSGQGNVVAFNAGAGVFVAAGTGDTVWGNSVFGNAGLGIDLLPNGPTANDPGDADTGANDLQNFPVITAVQTQTIGVKGGFTTTTTVTGTLDSRPGQTYRIELFAADPAGQGRTLLTATDVTTDAGGSASFSVQLPAALPDGTPVVATATNRGTHDTSEFTAAVQSGPPASPPPPPASPPPPPASPPPPAKLDLFAVGSGAGIEATVLVYNPDGSLRFTLHPFPGFSGGANVATGDGTLDGVDDIVVGAGPGGSPRVVVYDGATGQELASFFAYDGALRTGVFVGAGDVTGDGRADIVTGAGVGGAPHVKVFDWGTFAEVRSFFAFDPNFRGGVTVRAGDTDGDGFADIVAGAGPGGGPHVEVFSGKDQSVLQSFFAFDQSFTGGVFVGVADLNGDGLAELIAGGDGQVLAQAAAGGPLTQLVSEGGVATLRVAAVRTPAGITAVLIGAGPGGGPQVQLVDPFISNEVGFAASKPDLTAQFINPDPSLAVPKVIESFFAFDPSFSGGVFVG